MQLLLLEKLLHALCFTSITRNAYFLIKFNNYGVVQEELPESLLGTVRLEHLDLSQAAVLDTLTGIIERHQ